MEISNRKIMTLKGNQPIGLLSPVEIDQICLAYEDGCRGVVVIGLRGEERVITTLIPPRSDMNHKDERMIVVIQNLRRIGCDSYIHIYLQYISGAESKSVVFDQKYL